MSYDLDPTSKFAAIWKLSRALQTKYGVRVLASGDRSTGSSESEEPGAWVQLNKKHIRSTVFHHMIAEAEYDDRKRQQFKRERRQYARQYHRGRRGSGRVFIHVIFIDGLSARSPS